LGRETVDRITTSGAGVDESVLRRETKYDTQGNAYLFTSFDAATGGSIVNQVKRQFNGFGQITHEYQAIDGAVTIYTPYVEYQYAATSAGSRLTGIVYPSGYSLDYSTTVAPTATSAG